MVIPAIVIFIIGTIFGSFLSVVIYRIREQKRGIFFGKSECPYCHKKLKIRDLIPVLSFVVNKGRCRMCKKRLSIHYLLLEIITGLILVALYFQIPFINVSENLDILFYANEFSIYIYFAVISLFLISIWFYDLKYLEIPEVFTYPAIVIVLIGTIFLPEPGLLSMFIGGSIAAIFFGLQVLLSKETWLGIGDLQTGILTGLFLGWKMFIICLLLAYLLGSFLSIILLVSKKVSRKTKIPFAPFLVIATFITVFFGEYIYNLYLSTLI